MASDLALLASGSGLTLASSLATAYVGGRQSRAQSKEETARVQLQIEAERTRRADDAADARRAKLEPLLEDAGMALGEADRLLRTSAVTATRGGPRDAALRAAWDEVRLIHVRLRLQLAEHHPLVMAFKRGEFALAVGLYYAEKIREAANDDADAPADEQWREQLTSAQNDLTTAMKEFFGIVVAAVGVDLPAEPYDHDAAASALAMARLREKPSE